MFAASKTDSASIGGYEISRSLRFNDADSAYLNRTFTSAGNQKTWTWSAWVKRTGPTNPTNAVLPFFGVTNAGNDSGFFVIGALGDVISIQGWNTVNLRTTAVYRDYSAWYHIVVSLDTTQATAANRLKLYVNNVQETAFSFNTPPTLNADYPINGNVAHNIFSEIGVGSNELGGYLTEVNFIDGQALTPSSFGKTNAQTGVWQPKAFSGGAYGTNGFYLNFSDNSNTTAATLGKDYSGNGNNWTPNNFSVTAGVGNDSFVDSPTSYAGDTGAGGEVRGNYCILNAIALGSATLTNGNLDASVGGDANGAYGTIGVSSGKWYWEVLYVSGTNAMIGIANMITGTGAWVNAYGWAYYEDGAKYTNNTRSAGYGASYGTNAIISVALDMDAGTLTFYKNGTSQGVAYSSLSGTMTPYLGNGGGSSAYTINLGQRPFSYTAPNGFKALCTQNLSAGTITTSGSFTGNLNANGPFVFLNGVPTAMTINGNAVTFGTHADKLSNGFKVRSSSALYNNNVANAYVITTTGDKFKYALAQSN